VSRSQARPHFNGVTIAYNSVDDKLLIRLFTIPAECCRLSPTQFTPPDATQRTLTPPPIGQPSIVMSVPVCVLMFVCPRSYLRSYTSDLHQIFVHVTYGRGSVLGVVTRYVFPVLWMTPVNVILTHKLRLLDVAARLRQRGTHAALGFARRNTHCRQRTLLTRPIYCIQYLLGRGSVLFWRPSDTLCTSGFCVDDVIFAHKPKLLDVAAQLKCSAHAALGLAINCAQ